jgi:hypothetical protein
MHLHSPQFFSFANFEMRKRVHGLSHNHIRPSRGQADQSELQSLPQRGGESSSDIMAASLVTRFQNHALSKQHGSNWPACDHRTRTPSNIHLTLQPKIHLPRNALRSWFNLLQGGRNADH